MAAEHHRTREEFVDTLTGRLRQEVEQGLDEQQQQGELVTRARIETLGTQVKERLGREVQQSILDQQPEPSENRTACPACHPGAPQRRSGRRRR